MKVGKEVICINAKGIDSRITYQPIEDKIYTIRAIVTNFGIGGKKGLLLEEITNDLLEHPSGMGFFEPNFSIERFRLLVDTPQEELINSKELQFN